MIQYEDIHCYIILLGKYWEQPNVINTPIEYHYIPIKTKTTNIQQFERMYKLYEG